jgi:hypothetical protein
MLAGDLNIKIAPVVKVEWLQEMFSGWKQVAE